MMDDFTKFTGWKLFEFEGKVVRDRQVTGKVRERFERVARVQVEG